MDEDRVKHAIAVARKMIQIAKNIGLSENEINDCFIIGYNHDIGYEFAENIIEHNKIGGNILKECGFKYWKEIYYWIYVKFLDTIFRDFLILIPLHI